MKPDNDHQWRQYGPDDVACAYCGAEPWHRHEPCPGPVKRTTPKVKP